jgi:hypothetical protein
MRLRFVGSSIPVYGTVPITGEVYSKYGCYYPTVFFPKVDSPNPPTNLPFPIPFPIDFWVNDCQGLHLEQVQVGDTPDRRNGLPSPLSIYSYDGTIHIFPIYNNTGQIDNEQGTARLAMINRLVTFPYTYVLPYDGSQPTYDEYCLPILEQYIFQGNTNGALRVCFNNVTTRHNDGSGANKELDLSFSLYGIFNKNGLIYL